MTSNKCWTLEYSYNQYDQLGSYTEMIFREKPYFHKLKECLKNVDISTYLDRDVIYGKLSRCEEVCEYRSGGGDRW